MSVCQSNGAVGFVDRFFDADFLIGFASWSSSTEAETSGIGGASATDLGGAVLGVGGVGDRETVVEK